MSPRKDVLIVFASTDGNSEAIAEDLQEECQDKGLPADLCCIGALQGTDRLFSYRAAVFVAATTGE